MSVSLVKGQKISLEKTAATSLSQLMVGLGWDPVKKGLFGLGTGGSIDLDASIGVFDENRQCIDKIWFRQLQGEIRNGSIIHQGDNLTGEGEGDDEKIDIDLNKVHSSAKALIVVITSYSGQKFNSIANAFCRIVNKTDNKEILKYSLSEKSANTAMIMIKIYRHKDEWKVQAIGESTKGKTINDILSKMAEYA